MTVPDKETCWTLIRGAAAGRAPDREEFARRYLPTVRAYLRARWRFSPLRDEVDDVVQEVFVACFREGGALQDLESQHPSGFRALLYGVTRNVALTTERGAARRIKRVRDNVVEADQTPADELTLSKVFDRAYAQAIMRQARRVMAERAAAEGESALRRVELLRRRFEEDAPIRDIAREWGEDPARLHREYARARREFRAALGEAVTESERCPASRLEEECERLLVLLSR